MELLDRSIGCTTVLQGIRLACLALCALAATLSGPLRAAALPQDKCVRLLLPDDESLLWVASAAWSRGSLIVPDLLPGHFIGLDVTAQTDTYLGTNRYGRSAGKPVDVEKPAFIRNDQDGSILLHDAAKRQILRFNKALELEDRLEVGTTRRGANARKVALWNWVPFGHNGILGFGDIEQEPGWRSATSAVFSMGRRGLEAVYHDFGDYRMPNRNNYLRTNSYLASFGKEAYVLIMDSVPWIAHVSTDRPGAVRLRDFPEEFRHRPELPREPGVGTMRQATNQFRQLQRETVAAGIFAWSDALYLLGKKAMDRQGETRWTLIRLDRVYGTELSRIDLDTRAAALDVVPGDVWAFVEKGHVQEMTSEDAPYRDISSVLLYPNQWLASEKPPPSDECRQVRLWKALTPTSE